MRITRVLFIFLLAGAAHAESGNGFNPKISLVLDGSYAEYSSRVAPDISGLLLSTEAGLRPGGLSLGESELAIESNVDDQFHAWATISLAPEGGVGVEEAFINTLALPAGFAVKFGRFFSDIGYLNHVHAHAWEFVDQPLVYRGLLATQLADDGVQVRWVAPADLLLEFGVEGLRGAGFPGGGEKRDRVNSYTAFTHLGGDAGSGGSWRAGLSYLNANADDRRSGDNLPSSFTGNSHLGILDLIYKWAPQGNPGVTNFVFNAEYFYRTEKGRVISNPDGAAPDSSAYRGTQQGFYAQGIYQFMPRWRIGVRYDRLTPDNQVSNPAAGTSLATLADNHVATRESLMTDFSNSEFSRIRLQYNHDQSRPGGVTDHQIFLQYIMSIGSHPAHQF